MPMLPSRPLQYTSLQEQNRKNALIQQLRKDKQYARNPFGALAQVLNAKNAKDMSAEEDERDAANQQIETEEMNEEVARMGADYNKQDTGRMVDGQLLYAGDGVNDTPLSPRQSRTFIDRLRQSGDTLMDPMDPMERNYQSPKAINQSAVNQMDIQKADRANEMARALRQEVLTPEQEAQKIKIANATHVPRQPTAFEQKQSLLRTNPDEFNRMYPAPQPSSEVQQYNIAKEEDPTIKNITEWRKGLKQYDRYKLNKGERYKDDGSGDIEQIPGSKEYITQSNKHGKDYGALLTLDTKTKQGMKKIDYILDEKNASAFNSHFGGYNAYATKLIPGATQDMGSKITALKSDLKMAGLEVMRSGGSIGTMTEREWPIVEALIERLDTKTSEPEAREIFATIRKYMNQISSNGKEVYDAEWGATQYYKGDESGEGELPGTNNTQLSLDQINAELARREKVQANGG